MHPNSAISSSGFASDKVHPLDDRRPRHSGVTILRNQLNVTLFFARRAGKMRTTGSSSTQPARKDSTCSKLSKNCSRSARAKLSRCLRPAQQQDTEQGNLPRLSSK
jgi:hypothetical protein